MVCVFFAQYSNSVTCCMHALVWFCCCWMIIFLNGVCAYDVCQHSAVYECVFMSDFHRSKNALLLSCILHSRVSASICRCRSVSLDILVMPWLTDMGLKVTELKYLGRSLLLLLLLGRWCQHFVTFTVAKKRNSLISKRLCSEWHMEPHALTARVIVFLTFWCLLCCVII